MTDQQEQIEKQSISEMALKIFVGHFLPRDLTADQMIRVFDLIEQNHDGKARINSLMENGCTHELTGEQVEEAITYLNDFPEPNDRHQSGLMLIQHLEGFQQKQHGKKSLTARVTALKESGFLNPSLTGSEMICVFDLIEHNKNGKARIRRLMDEECTSELNEQQIEQAVVILEDYLTTKE
jgi:hypothetical protein